MYVEDRFVNKNVVDYIFISTINVHMIIKYLDYLIRETLNIINSDIMFLKESLVFISESLFPNIKHHISREGNSIGLLCKLPQS